MSRTLWAASARHLLRRPAQLILALIGLALGVATITAVDIATASANRAFELSLDAVSGPATNEITAGPAGLDEQLYISIALREPELAPVPLLEGYVTIGDEAFQLVGVDPLAAANASAERAADGPQAIGTLQAAGAPRAQQPAPGTEALGGLDELRRWLTEPGAAIMAASSARRLGLTVGSRFEIAAGGRPFTAVLIAEDASGLPGREGLILTDIAQAQEWLGARGRLSSIELRAPRDAAGLAALTELRAQLPHGVELQPVGRRSRTNLDMTRAFATNLHAMSLLALLVGLFLIYGAVSFAVLQRRRTFAVLRALGATRLEIVRLVMLESLLLGVAGALLGLGAGVALGRVLIALVSRTINDLYFVVAVNTVALPHGALATAVGAGVVTALLAAVLPAWEAARIEPQLGLKRSTLEVRAAAIARALVLASVVFALGSGAIVLMTSRSLLAGFVALFLLLLAVAGVTPALLGAVAQAGARVCRRSPVGRLALGGVASSLSRTGVAVASLGLAIAAMIGVSVMVGSFRDSLHEWLIRTMRADLYVTVPGPGFGRPERRIEPRVLAALTSVPGIAHFTATRNAIVDSPRGPISIAAVSFTPQMQTGIELVGERDRAAREAWEAFAHGAVFMAEPLAWRLDMHRGSSLTLETASGARRFEVAGLYREYGNGRGGVLMDRDVYRHWWGDEGVSSVSLSLAQGVEPADVVAALRRAAAGHQAIFIGSNADILALSMSIFDRTFVITRVLYWLAAGVAAIGLTSSLLAWELERARELGVLRSLGLTPGGAAALIEAQTIFMGLVAFVAAVPAGLLAAELLVTVINRRAFGWLIDFHLQGAQLANALWLAVAAAAAAGVYPAWRSARASIAAHLREE
ncbi:MAG TPA: FtsX-like permease family protein [Steroidobacteraceae bacterium]|nr:FtsX-like permease family protein [Steroidobacteraceae bacterium]